MSVLPLTVLRRVLFLAGGLSSGRWGRAGAVTGSGLVRPPVRQPPGRLEQVQPFLLAVPSLGRVEGDVAASVPGDPGGHDDEVAHRKRSRHPPRALTSRY